MSTDVSNPTATASEQSRGRDGAAPPEEVGLDYRPAPEALAAVLGTDQPPRPPSALSASLTFGWRAVLKIKHVPEQLFDVTAFPIIMVLMFTYLFGGALADSPRDYLQFFLPGIMVTSVLMITMYTGVGLNIDIEKGVFDRFRTLPIWRPAALVGMIFGDMLRYTVAATTIVVIGLVLGFRPGGGPAGLLAGIGLLIVFSFAFSWIWTMFGLIMRSEKAVMSVSMLILFPLTFLSNVFVDPSTMPGWLETFVQANPVSHVVTAVRSVIAGDPDTFEIGWVFAASAVLTAVFGTLTMRLYNRK